MTTKLWPATVIVAARGGPLFPITKNCTLPVPEPLPLVILIQYGALVVAGPHVQPVADATVKLP
jgi:hypothetical protein